MQTTIGQYLLDRLKSYGVQHLFGVPGDYNLAFLDLIEDDPHIQWVGNCNELNASYAADGYARLKSMGALLTTFGVGELSAINGIAGSYAESVPVVKIVGMPSRGVVHSRKLVHHTLGDGEFLKFYNMYAEVSVAQTILNKQNAQSEIDRVLGECFLHKKPVYIGLPVDVTHIPIETYAPSPLVAKSDPKILNAFLKDAQELLSKSKSQVVMADYEVNRYQFNQELTRFIEAVNLPIVSLAMGKGVFDETHPNFIGVYNGILSDARVSSLMKHADCAILVGVKLTDSLTAGFHYIREHHLSIQIHPFYSQIGEKTYDDILMQDVLKALAQLKFQASFPKETHPKTPHLNGKLTQDKFFKIIQEYLRPHDVLIAEQGTSFFGAISMVLPSGVSFIGQPLWGSIGYTFGALLGTALASPDRRHILLIGDGSFQLVAQELSTMLRENITPIIIVINNDGYTVERCIHGPTRQYNHINMWHYSKLASFFDVHLAREVVSFQVSSVAGLREALCVAQQNSKLALIEACMDKNDAPILLKKLGALFGAQI
ncbi:alpha-keto acid decarboxylase family protein [Helicobacter bizzozeronii]|uniref:alpha-keto acid decarboxylase family protein n=1 Tax=Helicobacter bizzozeronii TaxID=56877 RepID=UPI000CEDE933|nr:alpha-keto acid decarboxylase family protein [Helicobacter bizzozeronii]